MPVQQTSIQSFCELKKDDFFLSFSYQEILDCLKKGHAKTDYEMAKELGYSDPNKIRPRRNELVKKGYIKAVGKRQDNHTKKTAIIWDLARKEAFL